MTTEKERKEAGQVGLPPTSFLYTLDQICQLVGVDQAIGMRTLFYFANRSTGQQSPHTMKARDIASPDSTPDWRVAEAEFIRWLKLKRFKIDQRLTVRH